MQRRLTNIDTRCWILDARRRKISSHDSRVSSVGYRESSIENRASGLTIAEVVVASALLLIAIVPMLQALTTANINTADIEYRTRSLILAQAKLNEIKARSIYHYTNEGTSFAEEDLPLDGSYLCNIADDANDTLKTITVSVGYDHNDSNDLTSDEIEVTLTTLIARRWTD